MSPVAILIWILLIGAAAFVLIGGKIKQKNYKGQSMEITGDWYEQSQAKYGSDPGLKAYFFEFDKNYLTQGHRMVDQNRQPVYEAKILYGDPVKGYELDLINHRIDYKHHHRISATTTTDVGGGGFGVTASSSFRFDGVNIWRYLESLGYTYHFQRVGMLAYQINVSRNGTPAGTIYSSNNGKNYFGCEGPIEAKAGGAGLNVVECADRDLDALFLLTMAFARTEFSAENLK